MKLNNIFSLIDMKSFPLKVVTNFLRTLNGHKIYSLFNIFISYSKINQDSNLDLF